jgi:hypothetical protein
MSAKGNRYLGIELGGTRRTAVVAVDHYPEDHKIFLVEMHPLVQATKEETADEALARIVNELAGTRIGVDAPLSLPPCAACAHPTCPGLIHCDEGAVRWMRQEAERRGWDKTRAPIPYLQRPVDLLLRGRWQDESPVPFPVEDTFGSGRAPLAARMAYLKPRLRAERWLEVNPRLALGGLAEWYGITARELRRSRDVEEGLENRAQILEKISGTPVVPRVPHLFLYNSDLITLAQDLNSFDALLCALMAVFAELDLLEASELDPAWGLVAKPRRLRPEHPLAWGEP